MGLFVAQTYIFFYQNVINCGRLFCSDIIFPEYSDQDNELKNYKDKNIKYIT